jgi:hypothetical protein
MTRVDRIPPEIDYLAKDYASFRRLMLDHLSQLVPDWREQTPADLGHVLVELLAYAADHLSYYQDAVATEAYLGTARLRRSVRRHVRPLEYYLQEGCNARAWVQIQVNEKLFLPIHTQLLTRLVGRETIVIRSNESAYHQALQDGVTVFETMHHIYLMPHHNQIPILQRDREYCLSKGSTSARLKYEWKLEKTSENLKVGDVLVFEQQYDTQTGIALAEHRHAVRLTKITPGEGEADSWIDVEWAVADALPFDLYIAPYVAGSPESSPSIARGNIVLADHGRRIHDEELPVVQADERYRPRLRFPDLTFAAPFDPLAVLTQPACLATQYQPYEAFAWVQLQQYAAHFTERKKRSRAPLLLEPVDTDALTLNRENLDGDKILAMMRYRWTLRRDLLNSGPFDRDFQVEMEEGRWAYLRFGFGGVGKLPGPGERFVVTYRIGNGSRGNVGAETITHVVEEPGRSRLGELEEKIQCVRNPLPARGGADPEDIETARLHAPYAYRTQKACVTQADYARRVGEHPAVVHAVAHTRWIGSRHTVVIYVQRTGGKRVDEAFQRELLAFIEPFRLMGRDVEIKPPYYVRVLIKLRVYLDPRVATSTVLEGLSREFSQQIWPDGQVGFFYPDRFGFAQSLHQSQVIARAMAVPGVKRVEVDQFRRADSDLNVTEIPIELREIARLERIDFVFEGGL